MIDVFSQGYEAALLFCIGIVSGLLLDLCSWLGQFVPTLVSHLIDFFYVLAASVLFVVGLLLATNGTIRGFLLLFFSLGTALSAWAFYPIFLGKLQKIRK